MHVCALFCANFRTLYIFLQNDISDIDVSSRDKQKSKKYKYH